MRNPEFETPQVEIDVAKAKIAKLVPIGWMLITSGYTVAGDKIWSTVERCWKDIESEVHWSMEVWKLYGVIRKI